MDLELIPLSEATAQFNIVSAVLFFIFYLIVEVLDSSLTFSLTQHKSVRSALVTFILYTTIAIEIAAVISNYLYILPVAFGAAIGSFVTVEFEKKRRPIEETKAK